MIDLDARDELLSRQAYVETRIITIISRRQRNLSLCWMLKYIVLTLIAISRGAFICLITNQKCLFPIVPHLVLVQDTRLAVLQGRKALKSLHQMCSSPW